MKIYVASTNRHKIAEFEAMLKARKLDCRLIGADEVPGFEAPDENGKSFEENAFEKLLKELDGVPDDKRGAQFVCCIALILPDGGEKSFTGIIRGRINHGAVGSGGFGYDPLFFVPELGKTTAELSPGEKNAVSHRGQAFAKLATFLTNQK